MHPPASPMIPENGATENSQSTVSTIRLFSALLLGIFVIGWAANFFPFDDLLDRNGTPYGADFAMFYTAGSVVLNGDQDRLYDQALHQQQLQNNLPGIAEDFCLPYRYPPLVAFLMAGLAALPYGLAATLHMLAGIVCAGCGLGLLYRNVAGWRAFDSKLMFFAFLCCPLVFEAVIGGQGSLFSFLIVSAGVALMQQRRYAWAGVVFALALYKPNVLFFVILGCLVFQPRILRGLVPTAAGLLGLTWLLVGTDGIMAWINLSAELASGSWGVETPYWKVHGLTPLLSPLVGGKAKLLSIGLGVVATLVVAAKWRSVNTTTEDDNMLPYALLLTINALCNPYTPIYDLSLLLVGFAIILPPLLQRFPFAQNQLAWKMTVAALWFGPHLSQSLCLMTGFQFFALLLLVGLAVQVWLLFKPRATPTEISPIK